MAKRIKKLRDIKAYVAQLRTMDDKQLSAELAEHRARLFALRSQAVTEKVEDNSEFAATRRLIARVQTELSARRRRAAAGA